MSGKTWFSRTFGFLELESYDGNRKKFQFDSDAGILTSIPNNKSFYVGPFDCPSVAELHQRLEVAKLSHRSEVAELRQRLDRADDTPPELGGLIFKEIVGDARELHFEALNNGAVFQVASQFNALEMVGPGVTPEKGITDYLKDKTQGPACALACPAATIFRNYMVNGSGQGGRKQLNLLSDVEALLDTPYWIMTNGYCLPLTNTSMADLGKRLTSDRALADRVRSTVRVAIHWDTQVGSDDFAAMMAAGQRPQRVCQVFCSALPVSYCHRTRNRGDWAPFATLALEAAYDATLAAAALIAAQRRSRVRVFLTRLGGAAFGNSAAWIHQAIDSARRRFAAAPLDVFLVRFGSSAEGCPKI